MGSDGGQTQTTVQDQSPWAGQQPYLKSLFSQAQQMSGQPRNYYPGTSLGGQSAQTLEGQQAGLGLVRGAGQGASYDYLDQVLGGDFLNLESNPYLQQIGQQGAADITSNYQTAIAPGNYLGVYGRSGSGAEQNQIGRGQGELGDALSGFYANLYGGQYGAERDRQNAALGMSSMLGGNRRADIQLGSQLGGQADARSQQVINDLMNRYNYQRDEPGQRLDDFGRRIMGGGVFPGTSTSTTTSEGGGGFGGQEAAGLASSLMGMIAMMSSHAMKDEEGLVDEDKVLEQLRGLDVGIWRYNEQAQSEHSELSPYQHVGPYAEDWHAMFGLGNPSQIFFGDVQGICLAAIKALLRRVTELEKCIPSPLEGGLHHA